jgi:hypothetical protein
LARYESFTSGHPVEFVCYDDEYAALDWTKEPQESFDELMRRHAQYLRDKYKSVVLNWSGGTDSQTIYNIFVKNNIHIDEIVCWVGGEYEPWNPTSNYVWMQKNHPDPTTRITSKDRIDPIGRSVVVNNEDWIFQNITMIPKFAMGTTDVVMQEYCDSQYGEGNWCLITGHEQPSVYVKDNKYYSNHLAKAVFSIMGCRGVEPFYLDPLLTLKQSFMIKNFLKRLQEIGKIDEWTDKRHYATQFGIRSLPDRNGIGAYKAWSKVLGRHDELVHGASLTAKKLEERFNYAQVNNTSIDGELIRPVDTGLSALLAKDVDVAKTFERGIKNLLLEKDFCEYLMTTGHPNQSLIGKNTGGALFSRARQIG